MKLVLRYDVPTLFEERHAESCEHPSASRSAAKHLIFRWSDSYMRLKKERQYCDHRWRPYQY